ncbi:hypothetical protein NDU88_006817 [Pleurodeles waltl]|uniref:Uncharacterized protein n=1 Tax=Pleurodeles waltl TaxID=8319 RepID=A0AAV7WFV8_PLEWA|nr:hypothetical protein NDU88_006817 [Pleurodeles waltl]
MAPVHAHAPPRDWRLIQGCSWATCQLAHSAEQPGASTSEKPLRPAEPGGGRCPETWSDPLFIRKVGAANPSKTVQNGELLRRSRLRRLLCEILHGFLEPPFDKLEHIIKTPAVI